MEYLFQNLKEIKIVATITNNPNAQGIEKSKSYGINPIIINHKDFKTREDFDEKLVKVIKSFDSNLIVLAGFMRILTPIFTEQVKAINLHPSYLPYFKGSDAMKRSFESDMDFGGVSVHRVTSSLDDGEIIVQEKIIKKGLDFEEYQNQARYLEKKLLLWSINHLLS